MKQINKIFFGLLFGLGMVLLASPYQIFAQYQADNNDGGNTSGGTYTPPATIPAAAQINLTADLDKNTYSSGESMSLSSTALLSTSLGSVKDLLVFGAVIVDPQSSPTTIINNLNGGNATWSSVLFNAPTATGNYVLRVWTENLNYNYVIKNNVLKLGYLYDTNNNIVTATNLPVSILGTTNSVDLISTDNSGKILTIIGKVGGERFYDINSTIPANFDGTKLIDTQKTIPAVVTIDVPFNVVPLVAPTIDVWSEPIYGVNKLIRNGSINFNESTTINWLATGLGNDAYCVSPDYGTFDNSDPKKFIPSPDTELLYPYGSFTTDKLPVNKTYTVTCKDRKIPPVVTPPPTSTSSYYQLYRCGDHLTNWETVSYPAGTYSTGDKVVGATTGYIYTVTSSSSYPIAGRTDIQVTRADISTACN